MEPTDGASSGDRWSAGLQLVGSGIIMATGVGMFALTSDQFTQAIERNQRTALQLKTNEIAQRSLALGAPPSIGDRGIAFGKLVLGYFFCILPTLGQALFSQKFSHFITEQRNILAGKAFKVEQARVAPIQRHSQPNRVDLANSGRGTESRSSRSHSLESERQAESAEKPPPRPPEDSSNPERLVIKPIEQGQEPEREATAFGQGVADRGFVFPQPPSSALGRPAPTPAEQPENPRHPIPPEPPQAETTMQAVSATTEQNAESLATQLELQEEVHASALRGMQRRHEEALEREKVETEKARAEVARLTGLVGTQSQQIDELTQSKERSIAQLTQQIAAKDTTIAADRAALAKLEQDYAQQRVEFRAKASAVAAREAEVQRREESLSEQQKEFEREQSEYREVDQRTISTLTSKNSSLSAENTELRRKLELYLLFEKASSKELRELLDEAHRRLAEQSTQIEAQTEQITALTSRVAELSAGNPDGEEDEDDAPVAASASAQERQATVARMIELMEKDPKRTGEEIVKIIQAEAAQSQQTDPVTSEGADTD